MTLIQYLKFYWLLLIYRLSELNEGYEAIKTAQTIWPQPLPDPRQLYRNFYEIMHKVSYTIICACCGIIGHNIDEFTMVSDNNSKDIFIPVAVDPNLVPFSFECGIITLDQHNIIIDHVAIIGEDTISVYCKCYSYLFKGSLHQPRCNFAS